MLMPSQIYSKDTVLVDNSYLFLNKSVTSDVTTYPVSFEFSISQNIVNHAIYSQWQGMTTSWSGSYQGLNYAIDLSQPYFYFSENSISIFLELEITSSVYNGVIHLSPSLELPSMTIIPNEIIAQYDDLRSAIDAITQFTDSRLKDVIENILNPVDWIVFQGRLITQYNERWLNTSDIGWDGIYSIGYNINEDYINFNVTSLIQATPPNYSFQLKRTYPTIFFKIESNNEIELKYIKFYYGIGQSILFQTNTGSYFDESIGKYITLFDTNAISLTNLYSVILDFYIKRGDLELVWRLEYGILGSNFDWIGPHTITPKPYGD